MSKSQHTTIEKLDHLLEKEVTNDFKSIIAISSKIEDALDKLYKETVVDKKHSIKSILDQLQPLMSKARETLIKPYLTEADKLISKIKELS